MPPPPAIARLLPLPPHVPLGRGPGAAALEPLLESLLEQALQQTGFPVATLNLVLEGAQASVARGVLPDDATGERTARAHAFCRCVGVSGAPLHVRDAREDAGLPTALAERHGVRAYAGVPVRLHDGPTGTLAVVDSLPRQLGAAERRALEALALTAARRLELFAARR
ncbi:MULTISPECIES: GAF domain-containing protein [Myxococcaceae]|uniref:GAF domain-containing protein n=1 Tax=Myxococcaceae TaxID=31 RepID=UPI00188E0ED4|nr:MULTISPECIES: GAF domain-containing protein [Myxococcaceae]MBF5046488.1 GAF domain-containing protein [Simulacricoccus sp. 17bor-14]